MKSTNSPILLVDENAFSVIAIQGILGQYGLEVDHAMSFAAGFEMIKKRLEKNGTIYSLILVDSASVIDSDVKEGERIKNLLNESLESPLSMSLLVCMADLSIEESS